MTKKTQWVIQYDSKSTVNGRAVGLVYARRVDFIPRAWSYTDNPLQATIFDSRDDAESEAARHSWPEATLVGI